MDLMKRNTHYLPSSWNSLRSLQKEINALFDDDFFPASTGLFDRNYSPAVDVAENPSEYVVTCELPGLSESDLDVQVAENVLTIKGEKKDSSENQTDRWYKKESWFGSFQRTIPMPSGVDGEKIQAELESGILRVTLPKKEDAKAKQISIKVK